ncbi:MAG TPA: trehalose-phosphatase [Elusimicrobiota bacterium]|nr:trehalose-phosphatase [Elusimicrobiota bacterium]
MERLADPELAGARLLVALDFDGTLSAIAATPEKAVLTAATRRLLADLARRPDTKVAVISGRSLEDLRAKVGLSGVYYAGNHGLEIDGPGVRWAHPCAVGLDLAIRETLEEQLRDIPGVLVEHKRLGVTVHYRGVHPRHHGRLRLRMRGDLFESSTRYRVMRGKKTFDFRLDVPWDKGHALRAIRRTLKGAWTAVFVGDDVTDEEAFSTIGPRALTVRIGRVKRSGAQYVMPDRRQIDLFLGALARRRPAGPPPEGDVR